MQQPQAAPNAQCAVHPGRAATGVCARCGSFMCATCSDGGRQPMCPGCRGFASAAFPLTREDFDFSRVWDHAWASFSREWLMLSVAVVILLAIGGIGAGLSSIVNKVILYAAGIQSDPANPLGNFKALGAELVLGQTVGVVLNTVVQAVALSGLWRVTLDALIGRKADIGRMFVNLERLPVWILTTLLQFVIVQVPALLVLVVSAVVALRGDDLESFGELVKSGNGARLAQVMLVFGAGGLVVSVLWLVALPLSMFAGPELLVSGCSPGEAISRAWRMASGHRLAIVGYALMESLVVVVGALACCVGLVPAMALGLALNGTVFLALRDPAFGPATFE